MAIFQRQKARESTSPEVRKLQLFDRLVALHAREIRLFLHKLCGSHHDAEELTQDVFIKAFRRLDDLREEAAARRWLYRIAVNHFNDWVKPIKRTALRAVGDIHEFELRGHGDDRPSERALAGELSDNMREWILALPDRQRTVLLMHAAKGFVYSEIADALEISVDAVKMSLFHAREKLRKKVDQLLKP